MQRPCSQTLLSLLLLCITTTNTFSQTNIRGWYRNGQVWVVWENTLPTPTTYAIYASLNPFTNTSQATLVGRLFVQEWTAGAFRAQGGNPNVSYRIPDGSGGFDTLTTNEGLFVETVLQTGAKYYGVVKWGSTTFTAGVNRTTSPVNYAFSLTDPPMCHLQKDSTLATGYRIQYYHMWADGRQEHWAGRPDFAVMANAHKNGMPSLFILSYPLVVPSGRPSLVVWLHGGDGTARQSLPRSRNEINIEPIDGLLLSHNDDFIRYLRGTLETEGSNSWHFGWTKNHDPFDTTSAFWVPTSDTVINYTQRRYLWIQDWLVRNKDVDPDRIAIQGHSVGSAGTTAITRCFPNKFSTASVFNCSLDGPRDSLNEGQNLFGFYAQNLPTNLRNMDGTVVRIYDAFTLSKSVATTRDMPLIRVWNGKNDPNAVMKWDAGVVREYHLTDSLGFGAHLYWDERDHGIGGGVHWSMGLGTNQTGRDNASYQEKYRAAQSFPAFYNHRVYPGANKNPGNGTPTSGDPWGTWGGYHDWDLNSIVDTTNVWSAIAYLVGLSAYTVDNFPGPGDSLTADMMIRKPQRFLPPTGTTVHFQMRLTSNNAILRSGTTIVGANNLVSLQGVTLYKDPRRMRIIVSRIPLSVELKGGDIPTRFALEQNSPNPFNPSTRIAFSVPASSAGRQGSGFTLLKVFDVLGREVATLVNEVKVPGRYEVDWNAKYFPSGVYFYRLQAGSFRDTKKLILAK
jgi:hypothetical protein